MLTWHYKEGHPAWGASAFGEIHDGNDHSWIIVQVATAERINKEYLEAPVEAREAILAGSWGGGPQRTR